MHVQIACATLHVLLCMWCCKWAHVLRCYHRYPCLTILGKRQDVMFLQPMTIIMDTKFSVPGTIPHSQIWGEKRSSGLQEWRDRTLSWCPHTTQIRAWPLGSDCLTSILLHHFLNVSPRAIYIISPNLFLHLYSMYLYSLIEQISIQWLAHAEHAALCQDRGADHTEVSFLTALSCYRFSWGSDRSDGSMWSLCLHGRTAAGPGEISDHRMIVFLVPGSKQDT